MLGLPSVYVNRKRHIVPHDRIHDDYLVIPSPFKTVKHIYGKTKC